MTGVLETFRSRIADELPELDVFHVLNEGLLQELLRGRDPEFVYGALGAQLALVERLGAELIVTTCSSTSPGVAAARAMLGVPVLKIDDPMARRAVETGSNIGLLCTATSTLQPSTELLHEHARALDREITVEPMLVSAAYNALHAGDQNRHDRLVEDAAAQLASRVDVIVLAQASLAHLQERLTERLGIEVLASPGLLLDDLRTRVEAST
jgi:Asp/Glu/hydantoin racemase